MLDSLTAAYHDTVRRVRRTRRREMTDFRRWLETTTNLTHLTALVVVPLVIVGITLLSDRVRELSYLLWPPLASATYTLFTDPDGRYSTARNFVGGLSVGSACGWFSVIFAESVLHVPTIQPLEVHPVSAGLAVFLTIAITWAFDIEMPAAFSTALLAVVVGVHDQTYVVSVVVSTTIVAALFYTWRAAFYHRRSTYLYQSTKRDDHVLVPVRGEMARTTAMFAARLAAAHDAGKVVLLDVVDPDSIEEAEAEISDGITSGTIPEEAEGEVGELAEEQVGEEAGRSLERLASWVTTKVGVPCEVVVAATGTNVATTVVDAARETNCDLIVTPYEEEHGGLSKFTRTLFRSDVDVVAFRSNGQRTRWRHVMVPVRKAGDVAHAMIDFAERISGRTGRLSVCHCIARGGDRRAAETMLANLVETFDGRVETRVSPSSIEDFLTTNGPGYDLVIMGASTDRTTASRFVSPPTFERLHEIDCDVAILHRA